MKSLFLCFALMGITLQDDEVEIAHYRKYVEGKTLIGKYDFTIDKIGTEDNMDMIHRGYDTVKVKAKKLGGNMVYINGRRWRYMGRRLVIITEIYKD